VVLATVAQTTPLFGLLGTVLGLMHSLLLMQQQAPLVQFADVTRGLQEALVATAAGLSVAIPCYIAFNFLVGRVEKIVLDMERAASEILTILAPNADPHQTEGMAAK
jgi:biopolymer transport protein ExbB